MLLKEFKIEENVLNIKENEKQIKEDKDYIVFDCQIWSWDLKTHSPIFETTKHGFKIRDYYSTVIFSNTEIYTCLAKYCYYMNYAFYSNDSYVHQEFCIDKSKAFDASNWNHSNIEIINNEVRVKRLNDSFILFVLDN